jgi:uncharacterized DUF497 family protein
MPREFEWDDVKAAANEAKHGVPFTVATRVFLDPDVRIIETVRERDNEARSKAVGRIDDRFFTVVFTKRGKICRLISARRSNRTEERRYANHPL